MPGMFADELYWSRSERSSLEVALEQVSRPLSVAVGLDMEEAALSEAGRLDVGRPCSMNGTPSDSREKLSHTRPGYTSCLFLRKSHCAALT